MGEPSIILLITNSLNGHLSPLLLSLKSRCGSEPGPWSQTARVPVLVMSISSGGGNKNGTCLQGSCKGVNFKREIPAVRTFQPRSSFSRLFGIKEGERKGKRQGGRKGRE